MRLAATCLLGISICQVASAQVDSRYGASTPPLALGQGAAPVPAAATGGLPASPPPAGIAPLGGSQPFGGAAAAPLATPPAATPPVSPSVQPARPAQQEPFAPPAAARSNVSSRAYRADELMKGMMRGPTNAPLSGTPVRLEQVIATASDRSEQTRRIYAYWDLCSAVADYYLGLAESLELNNQNQALGGRNEEIRQAVAIWQSRVRTSQLAAVVAQRRLAAMMGAATLPLPGDLPLCDEYETVYDQAFAGRSSAEARDLNQLIPLRHAELVAAAANVTRAQTFLQSISNRSPNGDAVFEALQLLAFNRRAFVQIAKDYNRQITRYTELATPGDIGANRLVAMLVDRPRASSPSATASNPTGGSRMPPTRPQTFQGGLTR